MASATRRISTTLFIGAGVIVALILAGFVSYYASAEPDGLVSTAQKIGFIETEQSHARGDSTFSGYTTQGVENDRLSGALAGVVGVAITLVVGGVLFFAVRASRGGSAGSGGQSGH